MKPANLTSIDFEEIRESIKSYMRTRKEFSDYDFTGSTLSYLIDVLAYNTYYSAFNANMALNELFLDTSTIRDNVASLARFLNYLPRSVTSSKACISLNVQTLLNQRQEYPTYVTLKKGPVASGTVNGRSYTFVILDDIQVRVDRSTGMAYFTNFKVWEGDLLEYQYLVDTKINQKYIIPNDNVDTDSIKVFVKPNQQSTQYDRFNVVQNITNIDGTSRVFFLSEYEDRRYEITFGDGVIGKKLEDNQVVVIEYLRSNGEVANNIFAMSFIGTIIDSDSSEISPQLVNLTVNDKSQLGAAAETLKSIKFNAPRYYAAQNRAVTASDYEAIIRSIYPNAKYVHAYGGETLSPPVYGKVFVSIKTKTGTNLNNLTKKDIVNKLKPYAMASIDVVIEDPEEFFVDLSVFVTASSYDSLSQNTVSDIRRNILAALQAYGDKEDLGNFGSKLSTSQLQKVILESDPSITDVRFQTTPYKRIAYPSTTPSNVTSTPRSFNLKFGVELNCSCSSSIGSTVRTSEFYNNDYPNIPQYIEDDGAGTLRSYYIDNNKKIYTNNNAGSYNCKTGDVNIGPISIDAPTIATPPSFIVVSINPLNPETLDPGAISPGTILSIATPNIEIGTTIPSTFGGGTVGNPSGLSANPPAILEFTSPSSLVGNGSVGSCFV